MRRQCIAGGAGPLVRWEVTMKNVSLLGLSLADQHAGCQFNKWHWRSLQSLATSPGFE